VQNHLTDLRVSPHRRAEERGWASKEGTAGDNEVEEASTDDRASNSKEDVLNRQRRRQRFVEEGTPIWGMFGFLEWQLVAFGITALFVMQYMGPMTQASAFLSAAHYPCMPLVGDFSDLTPSLQMARAYWLYAAGAYTAGVLGHGLITVRDG
jgi:hypothetical protein